MIWKRINPLLSLFLAAAIPLSANAEELPVLLRSFSEVESPSPPFEGGRFEPKAGETIAILGGTNAFDADRFGHLERSFHLAWPEHELTFRCLAWQGDTIVYQARPRNFYTIKGDTQPGSVPDQRDRTEPGIIFLWFGKTESLEGSVSIDSFTNLIDQLKTRTSRLVLIAPTPYFSVGPAGKLAITRNEQLKNLVAELKDEASRQEILFLNLFTPLLAEANNKEKSPRLSFNGIHLTGEGHRAVTAIFAEQLHFPDTAKAPGNSEITRLLDQAITRKNRLWQQYYRPTNWAFLFGDRQHVPASRDPVERDQRWFLREIKSLPGLIGEADADIHRYAREAARGTTEK